MQCKPLSRAQLGETFSLRIILGDRKRITLALILALTVSTTFVPTSYAQSMNDEEFQFPEGMFTQISGKYVDKEAGLEIEFPDGWSGLGFGVMAMVVPGGIDVSGNIADQTTSVDAAMIVMALPRTEFSNAFSSIEALSEEIEENAADEHCKIQTYAYTKINSMDGIHLIVECDSAHNNNNAEQEEFSHVNMYGIMSENNFILVAFAATSSNDYNDHVESFEKSIKTLKIDHSVPFKTAMAQVLNLKTLNHSVIAKGDQIDLKVQSNSDVSKFSFNESHKRISARVAGQDGTEGVMIIAVDRLLEGPYTVTIDGKATNNFLVAEDQITGEKSIEINYSHSIHDIEITGTNVVPEFSHGAMAFILGTIGILAVIGRTKFIVVGKK